MASNRITDRLSFSKKEDLAILEFILKDNRLYFSGGLNIWKMAVNEGICPGRGFWSLKERFIKTICKNLQNYNLPIEIRHKVLNYIKASPAEKKRLKMEYGDDQDYRYIHRSSCKISTGDEDKLTNNENINIKTEIINLESNENDSSKNQPEPGPVPKSKSPFKHAEYQGNHVKRITLENDPKISVPSPGFENISENPTVVTDSKFILPKDTLSLEKSNVLSNQVINEVKCESFQQPDKCSDKPKPKSISKSKKTNALPITGKRRLRIVLTKLKNL